MRLPVFATCVCHSDLHLPQWPVYPWLMLATIACLPQWPVCVCYNGLCCVCHIGRCMFTTMACLPQWPLCLLQWLVLATMARVCLHVFVTMVCFCHNGLCLVQWPVLATMAYACLFATNTMACVCHNGLCSPGKIKKYIYMTGAHT